MRTQLILTCGDPAGIGPYIIQKALHHKFSEIDLSEMPGVMEVIVEHKTTGQANAKLFAINAVVTK